MLPDGNQLNLCTRKKVIKLIDPFISITDFMNRSQAEQMLAVFRELSFSSPRRLGIGVMASYAALNGIPSNFSKVFPQPAKIAEIFPDDPLAFNVIHYVDYHEVGGTNLYENLERLLVLGGPNLDAIQMDMTWPSRDDLWLFRVQHPDIKIILQIGRNAFDLVENNPEKLAAEVCGYQSSALDAVLLDMSMGEGRPMDWQILLPYLSALKQSRPNLGLVVGGGLGPDSWHLMGPLPGIFSGLSADAQGRLRPSGSIFEPVSWIMAEEYLRCSPKVFA